MDTIFVLPSFSLNIFIKCKISFHSWIHHSLFFSLESILRELIHSCRCPILNRELQQPKVKLTTPKQITKMSSEYRSRTPTTTVITSKGEKYEIKAPFLSSHHTPSSSRRNSLCTDEDTEKVLNQIRTRNRQQTPTRTLSTSPALSRRSCYINNNFSSHYLTPSTPSTISHLTRSGNGPPRPTPRMGSLPPLPPSIPKVVKHHYPLPPPSFPDAMISVSKRLRNRSVSPSPQYAALQVLIKSKII